MSLPLYQSSEASSQPLPCPWISRGLCRRSRSCLLHSSRRRAGPHALSAQTTSRGTTWHTDSRAHKHTHARTEAHTHIRTVPPPKEKKVQAQTVEPAQKYTSHKSAQGECRVRRRGRVGSSTGVGRCCQSAEGKEESAGRSQPFAPCESGKSQSPARALREKGLQRLAVAVARNYNASVRRRPVANTLFKYGHWHSGHSFLDNCDYKKLPPTHTHTERVTYLWSAVGHAL